MQDRGDRSLFGGVARACGVLGLIGIAVLALLSGSDRQSREFPNAPSLLGWPYDTGAARAKAILAFVRTGPNSAIGYARRGIVSDPISIQAVSILGRSQLYAGKLEEANRTFEVAAKLGWRDPMTEMYWLDKALQVADYEVAAQRLDALLRQSPNDENRDKFLAIVSQTADGRSALAERLKLAPSWARTYLSDVAHLSPEEVTQRVDLLRRTGRGVWDCRDTAGLSQKLIEAQKLDEAQSVWRINCASPSSLVYDGQFDHIDTTRSATAFDWQLSTRGDIEIEVVRSPQGGQMLKASVSGVSSLQFIRQLIVLKPGRYRLTWDTPDTPEDQARALQVSLACKADLGRAMPGQPDLAKPERHRLEFTVAAECPASLLTFWLAPGPQVALDNIKLDPL